MFKPLPLAQRHTACSFCNYHGCGVARNQYGQTLGHFIWTVQFGVRRLKQHVAAKIHDFKRIKLEYSKIEVLKIEGISGSDAPDFSDAYISEANYGDRLMTDDELDALNDDSYFVTEAVIKYLY